MTLAEFFPIGDHETDRSRYEDLSPATLLDMARRHQGAQSYTTLNEIGIALKAKADKLDKNDPLRTEVIVAQIELGEIIKQLQ